MKILEYFARFLDKNKYEDDELVNEFTLTEKQMASISDSFINSIKDLPVNIDTFGMKNCKINLEQFNSITLVSDEPIYRTKVDSRFFKHVNLKEIHVLTLINLLGLDKKIWRIEIDSFCTYRCNNDIYFDNLVEACNNYMSAFLNLVGLNNMMYNSNIELKIPSVLDVKNVNSRSYEGYVKTYFNNDFYIEHNMDIIDDLQPSDDSYIIGSIQEGELEIFIKENTPYCEILKKVVKEKSEDET